MRRYVITYPYKGDWYGDTIMAESMEDAIERLAAIRYARLDGELVAEVPFALGWMAMLVCWLRNVFRKRSQGGQQNR